MFCTNCGNKLEDSAKFCPYCGQMIETKAQPAAQAQPAPAQPTQPAQPTYTAPEQPTYTAPEQPTYTAPEQPTYTEIPTYQTAAQPAFAEPIDQAREADKRDRAKSILIKGILSVVFPETFFLAFLGIIFGSQGKRLAAQFEADYQTLTPMARVGKILSTVGFILSWVMTGLLIFYILYFVLLIGLLGL